jgi:hypothetical protein
LRRAALQDDQRVGAIVLLANSDGAAHEFNLPGPWLDYSLLVDTARPAVTDEPVAGNRVAVTAHSLVVLAGNLALQDVQPVHTDCDEARAETGAAPDMPAEIEPSSQAVDESVPEPAEVSALNSEARPT